jgi:hypothetical protein
MFYDSVLLRLAGPRLFVFFFALDVVIAVCVIVLAVIAAKQSIARRDSMRFFWLVAVLFFLVGLVMPGAAEGISDPGARMVQLALWCAASVLVNRDVWMDRVLYGCSAALIGLSLYQMAWVAERAPIQGTSVTSLPMRLIEFDHVEYSARSGYYDKISQGNMNGPIFPTAIFTERSKP